MSTEIDIAGHTISATSGGLLTLLVDKTIRFFREAKRRDEELETAKLLQEIKTKLDTLTASLARHELLAERVAKLEGIEEGRKQAAQERDK